MRRDPKKHAKLVDRLATAVITAGGAIVIIAVVVILVLIASEAVPLFRGVRTDLAGQFQTQDALAEPTPVPALAAGTDEYLENGYVLTPDGTFHIFALADETSRGRLTAERPAGASRVRDVHALGTGDFALLWDTDAVTLERLQLKRTFTDEGVREIVPVLKRVGAFPALDDSPRRQIRAAVSEEGSATCVSLLGDGNLVAQVEVREQDLFGDVTVTQETLELVLPREVEITHFSVSDNGQRIAAGTAGGSLMAWQRGRAGTATLIDDIQVNGGGSAVTALGFVFGGQSVVVADEASDYAVFSLVPISQGRGERRLARIRELPALDDPVTDIVASRRNKAVMGVTRGGGLVYDHVTSQRRLLRLPPGSDVTQVNLSRRGNGFLTLGSDGLMKVWTLDNPHPETSVRTLFGRVWYEGYAEPQFVWQSSSASDDFEPKLSLVPLIFGSIKGTLYAMIFAVPLALLGALYTSQLTRPEIRAVVKPAIEIMAAIPSVIIGFLAALWLAPLLERNLGAVFLSCALLPLVVLVLILIWQRLREIKPLQGVENGYEFIVTIPLLILGVMLAGFLGPGLEDLLFDGDLKRWLWQEHGVRYDPRNCVVIAFALGFAVIPIIFTISEDAFSNVPRSLTAASLALGASRWQTVWKIVLPSASPGVFAGIMIGLGRAVGETMIVLMATGNTPILDWSIFNGMRTLSANIAVEIPEAPHGGTLYRVLFLSAMALFIMTFFLNTIAELVRQRLRAKYAQFQ